MNLKNINCMIKTGEIKIHVTSLPPGVYGFVYYSRKVKYNVFVSEDLSPQAQQEVLSHEIYHIVVDMPKFTYAIGLDMQWGRLERKACCVAREGSREYSHKSEGGIF